MSIDFAGFERSIDIKKLKQRIKNAKDAAAIPPANYKAKVDQIILTVDDGDPMFSCQFKIIEGDYTDSVIIMNQPIDRVSQRYIVDEFLKSLGSNVPVEFISYEQYAQLIIQIAETIDGKFEYLVNYGKKNGFTTFNIETIFDIMQ